MLSCKGALGALGACATPMPFVNFDALVSESGRPSEQSIKMNGSSSSGQQPARYSGYRTGLLSSRLEAEHLAPSRPFDRVSLSEEDSLYSEKAIIRSRQKEKKTHCSLGTLDIMPPEIRNQVFLELGFASLSVVRGMSHVARRAVDALVEYRTIRTQAPELVRTITSSGVINPRPVTELHASLSKEGCYYCGEVAEYL